MRGGPSTKNGLYMRIKSKDFEGFGDFFEDFSKVFDVKTLKEKSAEI